MGQNGQEEILNVENYLKEEEPEEGPEPRRLKNYFFVVPGIKVFQIK